MARFTCTPGLQCAGRCGHEPWLGIIQTDYSPAPSVSKFGPRLLLVAGLMVFQFYGCALMFSIRSSHDTDSQRKIKCYMSRDFIHSEPLPTIKRPHKAPQNDPYNGLHRRLQQPL